MPHLVIGSINGAPSFVIEYDGAGREPNLRKVHERVRISDETAALGVREAARRWAAEELL